MQAQIKDGWYARLEGLMERQAKGLDGDPD